MVDLQDRPLSEQLQDLLDGGDTPENKNAWDNLVAAILSTPLEELEAGGPESLLPLNFDSPKIKKRGLWSRIIGVFRGKADG